MPSPPPSPPVTDLYMHAIRTPEHAGKALRALCLPLVGRVLRALVATLPASFWVSVFQLVLNLLPYLTTTARNSVATVASGQDTIEKAIEETR